MDRSLARLPLDASGLDGRLRAPAGAGQAPAAVIGRVRQITPLRRPRAAPGFAAIGLFERENDPMTEPISTRNLDRYGSAELPWSRLHDLLTEDTPTPTVTFFVATVRPDGRPHSAGVGALWVDDALYFVSGPSTQKSRNLAANSACTVSVRLRGIDLVLEGEAHRVTDAPALSGLPPGTGPVVGRRRWRATPSPLRTARRAPDHRRGTCTA
jgi:hypothetical protein